MSFMNRSKSNKIHPIVTIIPVRPRGQSDPYPLSVIKEESSRAMKSHTLSIPNPKSKNPY